MIDKDFFNGFHHITFWVGNAKQAAAYYCSHIGFEPYAYKGLETGERNIVCHVVRKNGVIFEFQSSLIPNDPTMTQFLGRHGDSVKDIAFAVDDCESFMKHCEERPDVVVVNPLQMLKDEKGGGVVKTGTIKTYGDVTHTLIEKEKTYMGLFLPGYQEPRNQNATIYKSLPQCEFISIDHCVGNQLEGNMLPAAKWYERNLNLHRFWSIDDEILSETHSAALTAMTNTRSSLYMLVVEPTNGGGGGGKRKKKKSQIQEFNEYNDGPGVQHIALLTNNIIDTVCNMRYRGCEFISIPDTYYSNLKERLSKSPIEVKEDIDQLQKHSILVDFDDKGYLLQIFTKPMQDRPTFFIEVIQRYNYKGFGAGNIKALFEAVEMDQKLRGNLEKS